MARRYLFPAYGYGRNATPSQDGKEALLQTFLKGAVLVFSGGYLAEGGANPTGIVGVALEPGHNTAANGTKRASHCPALDNLVFEISIDKASALGGAAAVLAQTDVGGDFGITKDAAGIWYLDVDKAGANQVVNVVDLKDPAGTVQGRCFIRFKRSTTFNA